jgi:hypothetical protein
VLAEVGQFSRSQTKTESELHELSVRYSFLGPTADHAPPLEPERGPDAWMDELQAERARHSSEAFAARSSDTAIWGHADLDTGPSPPSHVRGSNNTPWVVPRLSTSASLPDDRQFMPGLAGQSCTGQQQSNHVASCMPRTSWYAPTSDVSPQRGVTSGARNIEGLSRSRDHTDAIPSGQDSWQWHSNAAFRPLDDEAHLDSQVTAGQPVREPHFSSGTFAPRPSMADPGAAEPRLPDITVGSGFATYEDVVRLLADGRPSKVRTTVRLPHLETFFRMYK